MRMHLDGTCGLVLSLTLGLAACGGGASLRPSPFPGSPGSAGVTGDAESTVATMRTWLIRFREEQDDHKEFTGRYADDVTVGGELDPLPPPYRTDYSVAPNGQSYSVVVANPESRRRCRLADGREASRQSVPDAGRISCRAY